MKRGKGFWNFNNLLLEDASFVQLMNSRIEETINANSVLGSKMLWEMIKLGVSEFSSKFAAEKAKKAREHLMALNKELTKIQQDLVYK